MGKRRIQTVPRIELGLRRSQVFGMIRTHLNPVFEDADHSEPQFQVRSVSFGGPESSYILKHRRQLRIRTRGSSLVRILGLRDPKTR